METEHFRLVSPEGAIKDMVGPNVPKKGDLLSGPGDGYIVGFVDHFQAEIPLVFLNPATDEATVRAVIVFDVRGARYPLTLAEAAEFRRRARQFGASRLESSATTVAVRMDQLLEDPLGDNPPMSFLDSELEAVRWIIEGWLIEVHAEQFPDRVMDLRYALFPDPPSLESS